MLLCTVQFLCSVVAAFARLVRVLRKAMASVLCCSPASTPAASPATPLSLRRKVHPAQLVSAVRDPLLKEQLVLIAPPAPVAIASAECNGGGSAVQAQTKKKVAWASRIRPSMLVIPAAPDAGQVTAGWEVAVAEKEAEKEIEGEGFWLASRRGARHAMEDGYGVITQKNGGDSRLAFYGVYDGHGGRAAVDLVSERLGKNMVAAVEAEEESSVESVTAAIRAAYLRTDSEFLGQGVRGGSCAATALVKDGDLYVANLGDCRAVMSRDGAATALTSDHTAGREDERARIESSGGYVSCGSNGNGVCRVQGCLAVSRSFGDDGLKRWVISEPEISRVPLAAGCEFLVIASDGLWNKVSNQEAVDAVSRSSSRGSCCKELVDMARGRGSRDDITVMVVDLKRFLRIQ